MRVSAFSKSYDGRPVLNFPGMDFTAGRIYAIIGANGSGKTSFAKILAGIVKSDQKQAVSDCSNVGYMPQKNYAFRMSVLNNILLGGNDKERAAKLMDALQLSHLETNRADKLSGGETARMALARLMMKRFDTLILDEPTAAMDMETTSLAEDLILQYAQETGCMLILVTHSLQQAQRIADEVLFFHKGQLLERGPKERVLYHPTCPETQAFLEFYGI